VKIVTSILGRDATLLTPAWLCVLAAVLLSLAGVYAIDVGAADRVLETPGELAPLALKQLIFVAVGALAACLVALPHYRVFRYLAWPIALACIALLVVLIAPGVPAALVTPRNGVRGWIDLGPVDLQPGELTKIAYVLVVADYLRYRTTHRTIAGLIWPGLLCAAPVGLIFLQPDLGMAMLFVPAMFAMLIAAGAKLKHMAAIVLIGLCAIPAMYPFLKPYQQQRIVSMFAQLRGERHMTEDIGYQAYTAATLVGAGGAAGYPEAKSRAVIKYNALPERHNDMIFAVIVNRWGLLGGLVVMALYLVWFAGALLAAAVSREPFGRIVIVGCTAFMAVQVFINTSMVVGIAPIIGLTLPFVSYGGSSMLTAWVMTGLVLAVGIRRAPRFTRHSFEFSEDQ
jgi:cell division protein FtsW (lipid II flippase)